MANKKEAKTPEKPELSHTEEEKKLLEAHPFETESQVQNRYGKGRKKNGSDETPHQDGRGSNH